MGPSDLANPGVVFFFVVGHDERGSEGTVNPTWLGSWRQPCTLRASTDALPRCVFECSPGRSPDEQSSWPRRNPASVDHALRPCHPLAQPMPPTDRRFAGR